MLMNYIHTFINYVTTYYEVYMKSTTRSNSEITSFTSASEVRNFEFMVTSNFMKI